MKRPMGHWVLLAVVLLVAIVVGERLVRDLVLTLDAPRAVTARGNLAEFERQNVEIFAALAPSVAYIYTESSRAAVLRGAERGGTGSGFIWDVSGHVVTNHHVIRDAARVAVRLDSGEAIRATVVGTAPDYDLAVLKLTRLPRGLKPIPIGTSADLQVGQAVLAIGNPFGLARTLTTGIVSAVDRNLPTDTGREIINVIQTDAAINPGNSGGPLLDSAGRLIGVNTAIISETGGSAGIGFAVPVDSVNRVVPAIIAHGKAPRPGIGITVAGEAQAARIGVEGVVIMAVLPGGAAERAGLRGVDRRGGALGDVVVAIDGRPVRSLADLAAGLERAGIGKTVTVTLWRDGETREVRVQVMDIG